MGVGAVVLSCEDRDFHWNEMLRLAANTAALTVALDKFAQIVCCFRFGSYIHTLQAHDYFVCLHIPKIARADLDSGMAPYSGEMNLPLLAVALVADMVCPKLVEAVEMVCLRLVTVAGNAESEQESDGPDSHY